jgi:hypothetical protein
VEKSATKGAIILGSAIKGNAFLGHDYSLESIAKFFNRMRIERLEFDLFNEERELKKQLLKINVLKTDSGGTYQGQKRTALLGFAQAEQYPADVSPKPQEIYRHEIFPGLWFTTNYRYDIADYWRRIPAQEKQIIREILYHRAQYDPQDVLLMQREFASYFRDYKGQELLSPSNTQQMAISTLEAYQRELRKIELPYLQALTQKGMGR